MRLPGWILGGKIHGDYSGMNMLYTVGTLVVPAGYDQN